MKRLLLVLCLCAVSASAQVPTPTTTKSIEFVYVLFGGDPASAAPRPNLTHDFGEDLTLTSTNKITDTNNAWNIASYGHVRFLRGAVYGYVTVPLDAPTPGGVCNQSLVIQAASKLLPPQVAGAIRSHFVPNAIYCGNSYPTFPDGKLVHEAGHMIGFAHEHSKLQNGTVFTYPDYGALSFMGDGGTNIGAEMKDHGPNGGFFDAVSYQIVTVTATQDVVLTPMDTFAHGIKALKVVTTIPCLNIFCSGPTVLPIVYAELRPGHQGGPTQVLLHDGRDDLLDLDPGPGVKWSLDPGDTRCFPTTTTTAPACLTNLGYGAGPTATIHVGFEGSAPPPPAQVTISVVSPVDGASFPIKDTSTTGFTAVVLSNAQSVTAFFGPHGGSLSSFKCGAPPQQYYPSCTMANGMFTFQIKTGAAAGPRDLYFVGDGVNTPVVHLMVTP